METKFRDHYEEIVNWVKLQTLIQLLACDQPKIHISVLRLINTVFEKTPKEFQQDLTEVILEKNDLRSIVLKNVQIHGKSLPDELLHELFLLQNMVLYKELEHFHSPTIIDDYQVNEFRNIVQLYEQDQLTNVILKKIGFKNPSIIQNDLADLSNLVIDSLTFYITKNPGVAYYPELGPSLLEIIILSVKSLTKLLQNFTPSGPIKCLPLLLEREDPFEEIVCKLIKNHRVFIKNFNAKNASQIKPAFCKKIKLALKRIPFDFDRFYSDLEKLDKNKISQIMNEEETRWKDMIKNHESVKSLRLLYAPRVEELIKKQTFDLMSQGISAEYIPVQKSKKSKEEKITLKLNTAQNGFEYTLDSGATPITVSLSEINRVYNGDAAKPFIDEKILKKIPISTLVVFDGKTDEKHAFSIEPTHHQIISDVINFAENKKIDDKWEPNSYPALMESLINILLMDLNEKDIPREPPPVPPPPPNFEFSVE
ncbi:Engulfment and cell motility protein 1 [Thelohanellus kitauei]|uniref:Engulfment and cell motility protein 1 n=1 Tax=Thelohanellus kitauei TaxID=669202 RepID=A0A0C2IBQ9_THEKT|nr:Engulfment and cell motility protein 1 [Thelohanellus kitauei]